MALAASSVLSGSESRNLLTTMYGAQQHLRFYTQSWLTGWAIGHSRTALPMVFCFAQGRSAHSVDCAQLLPCVIGPPRTQTPQQ
jgi:hypothetical protein